MLYLLINKTSSVLTEKNIRIRKTFTPLNSVKKVQFRSQNKTLPKLQFLRRPKKQKSKLKRQKLKKIHPKHKKKPVNRWQDTQVSKTTQQSKDRKSKKVSHKVSFSMLLFS